MQFLDPNRTFPAKNDNKQNPLTIRATVNFNDALISTGFQIGTLPQNAMIQDVDVDIVTAFNAATTNVLTVGTTAANANELVAGGDVNEGATGNTGPITRGRGRALTAAGDVGVYVKYTQSGTAATAGQATITVTYSCPTAN